MAWHHHQAGEYHLAQEYAQKTIELEPAYAVAHWFLALQAESRFDESIAALRRAVETLGANRAALGCLGQVYAAAGEEERARAVLEQMKEASRQTYVASYEMGMSSPAGVQARPMAALPSSRDRRSRLSQPMAKPQNGGICLCTRLGVHWET